MVQMAFCDLSHTFHKQVTNVSQHVFVILLWGILTSPLKKVLIFSISSLSLKQVISRCNQPPLLMSYSSLIRDVILAIDLLKKRALWQSFLFSWIIS